MAVTFIDEAALMTVPGSDTTVATPTFGGPCAYQVLVNTEGFGAETIVVHIATTIAGTPLDVVAETFTGPHTPPGWSSPPVASADGSAAVIISQATGSPVDVSWSLLRLS